MIKPNPANPNLPARTAPPLLPATTKKPSAVAVMAQRCNVEPQKLFSTLKDTVFKGATEAELMTLVLVSNRYDLDPFLKQIYAFPDRKRGGIVPMVPIDGWVKIVNKAINYDGCEFEWEWSDETKRIPFSCTCIMHLKNRSKPLKNTEYYHECYRDTEPWNKMPCRQLKHKAFMQTARYAFGLSGIYDEDEAHDIVVESLPETPERPQISGPAPTAPTPMPEPEPIQQEAQTQALTTPPPAVVDPFEGIGQMTLEQLTARYHEVMAADNVGEDQFSQWCREKKFAKPDQEWTELSESKLRNIAKVWAQNVEEMRGITI